MPPAAREPFLDAIRTAALIRVVLWHAVGAAVLTYFMAAVPAMFFVTGSLLAKSLRRGAWQVIVNRATRILVPLWVFALSAYLAMYVSHVIDGTAKTAVPWRDGLAWLVPLVDPHGSPWEGGYLSAPLWYLRALLWLILLAPLLLHASRRWPAITFAAPLVGLGVLEYLDRTQRLRVTSTWSWRIGDLCVYSVFVMVGFAHRDGRLDGMARRDWLTAAVCTGAVAAVWCLTQPLPDGVVNNSHPAHLLVGLAWLCSYFAARPAIEFVATSRPVAGFIRCINQRTLTIYLWHPAAVITSFELLRRAGVRWPRGAFTAALLALTCAVTIVFVLAFGWIEDLANRRAHHIWPQARRTMSRGHGFAPRPIVGLAACGVVVLFGAATASARIAPKPDTSAASTATLAAAATAPHLRVPSQQPRTPTFTSAPPSTSASKTSVPVSAPATAAAGRATAGSRAATAPHANVGGTTTSAPKSGTVPARSMSTDARQPAVIAGTNATDGETATDPTVPPRAEPAPAPTVADRLAAAVNAWVAAHDLPGVEVAVSQPGTLEWSIAAGHDPAGAPVSVDTRFDIASVTKTFTATLVWQAIDAGTIDPDAPIGQLRAVPTFPYTNLTVRQLLGHTSGLVNYRDTPQYKLDPASVATPAAAVAAAGGQPLMFPSGSQSGYSSVNYLVLGMVLEQVTGSNYDDLASALLAGAGLPGIVHDPPAAGEPNYSTSGYEMTVGQLARWAVALLHDNTPKLSDTALHAMEAIDPLSTLGQGLWGYCPCTVEDGNPHWAAYGHSGTTTVLQYSPDSGVAIVVNATDSIWDSDIHQQAVLDLVTNLRGIATTAG